MRRMKILVFCRRRIRNLRQSAIGAMRTKRKRTTKRKKKRQLPHGGLKQRRITPMRGPAAGRRIGGRGGLGQIREEKGRTGSRRGRRRRLVERCPRAGTSRD